MFYLYLKFVFEKTIIYDYTIEDVIKEGVIKEKDV